MWESRKELYPPPDFQSDVSQPVPVTTFLFPGGKVVNMFGHHLRNIKLNLNYEYPVLELDQ
jgi:hypothetical protein